MPVAPGEPFLNGISRLLFGAWLPPEIWGRIPGILWGAWTLAVLKRLAARFGLSWLPFLALTSVGFTTLSVLMRPYASLIFSGALALETVTRSNNLFLIHKDARTIKWSGRDRLEFASAILLTHVYGICFLGLAAFLERQWKLAILAGFTLALVAFRMNVLRSQPAFAETDWLGLARNVIALVTNPHKVWILGLILLVFGAAVSRSYLSPLQTLKVVLLAFCTSILPTIATVSSGYFFASRQVSAAMPIGWLFLAFGCRGLRMHIGRWAVAAPLILGLLPWTLGVVLRRPPYPDQPIHRYRQIAQQLSQQTGSRAFFAEYWERLAFQFYLERTQSGYAPVVLTSRETRSMDTSRFCNRKDSCVDFPTEPISAETTLESIEKYDTLLYGSAEPPHLLHNLSGLQRTW